MLDKLLFALTQKLAVLFVAGLPVLGGLLTMGPTHIAPSSQMAIVASAAGFVAGSTANGAAPFPSSSPIAMAAVNLPAIPLGMLPTTTIPFCPSNATSTCSRKNLQALIRVSALLKKNVALAASVSATAVTTTTNTTAVVAKKISPTPVTITAQSFLADTTSSIKALLNGMDELLFTTTLGGQQAPLTWGLLTTTVGGTGTVPAFSVTTSCNPAPRPADAGNLDQNPTFTVRTSYDCSVSLTPQSGSNQVTQSKDFSFTTAPGALVVNNDPAMNPLLLNNTNNGGITFNNQDSQPVTVTGLTFDASYSYLSTLNGPLVLRFLNPATGQSLVDYHLEKLPASPSASNTYSQPAITIPISFTIAPLTQKVLPIQVLGVDRMFVLGTTPSVSITLDAVTTNTSGIKEILNTPRAAWSCVVSTASYDPNATSGPFATGQACLN